MKNGPAIVHVADYGMCLSSSMLLVLIILRSPNLLDFTISYFEKRPASVTSALKKYLINQPENQPMYLVGDHTAKNYEDVDVVVDELDE